MDVEQTDAQDVDTESSAESKTPEAPKPIRDFVKTRREASRAAVESARPSTEQSSGDAAEGNGAGKGEAKNGGDEKPALYSDEEMASMDLRNADLNRVPVALRETVKRMQAAETRKHRDLNAKAQELDDLIARARKQVEGPADVQGTEEEEDPNAVFTAAELRQAFRTKAGREVIAEIFRDAGVNLDAAKAQADEYFMQSAVADAMEEAPELQDQAFLDAVTEKIRSTPKWAKTIRDADSSESGKRAVSLVFQAAAGLVKGEQAAAEKEAAAKEKAAAEAERKKQQAKTAASNRKPSSHAAGATRTPTIPLGQKPSIVEFIRTKRAADGTST